MTTIEPPAPPPTTIRDRIGRWKQTAIDFSAYAAVRLLVAIIQMMPLDMGDSICRSLAWLLTGPIKIRKSTTEKNLRAIFPGATEAQHQQIERQMWHHLLLMVCEIAWSERRLHLTNWHQHVRFKGNQAMLRNTLSGRPTVLVTGHYGNFEIGGRVTGLMGLGTLTIARKLDNRFIHDWVEQFRSSKGQHMVDKEGCATTVEDHLQNCGILSLLADQHAGPKGCWVNFMGAPASSHKALALFALSADAPMLVCSTRRLDRQPMQFEVNCTGIADPLVDQEICAGVTSLTTWYNERLADAIQLAPEQYWWLHRRWRDPPPRVAKRLGKQLAKAA